MRHRAMLRHVLVIVALAAGAPPVLAQAQRHELTDEDVAPLRQLLPARAALVRWRTMHGRDLHREMREVAAFPLVPPGARYDAQCSLEGSGYNADEASTRMVFTLPSDRTDSEVLEKAVAVPGTAALSPGLDRGMDVAQVFEVLGKLQSTARADADSRVAPLHRWYLSQGFRREPEDDDDPGLYKAARNGLTIRAEISNTNSLFREEHCMHLNGPMIVVERRSSDLQSWEWDKALIRRLSSIPLDGEGGDAPPPKSEAEEAYASALDEAGMSAEAVEDLLRVVFTVRRYLASTPADQAMWRNSLSGVWRDRLDASVEWYRNHGSNIAPLLDELHRAYDHPGRSAAVRP